MKTIIALLLALAAAAPIAAASPNEKRLSMEQRLRETDLSVALKHYERVCTELMDARLKLDLASVEDAKDAKNVAERENQIKLIALRIDILERYAKNLREELLKAGRIAGTSITE